MWLVSRLVPRRAVLEWMNNMLYAVHFTLFLRSQKVMVFLPRTRPWQATTTLTPDTGTVGGILSRRFDTFSRGRADVEVLEPKNDV
jgi:hypothetical protein